MRVQGLCQVLPVSFITYIRYMSLISMLGLQADATARTPRLNVNPQVLRRRANMRKSNRLPVVSIAESHLHVLRIHFTQYDLAAFLSRIKLLMAPYKLLVPIVAQAPPYCCSSVACYQTGLSKVSDDSSVLRYDACSLWSLEPKAELLSQDE